MAPGKKKKKVTSNPARGFATVSVASKGASSATQSEQSAQEDNSDKDGTQGRNTSKQPAPAQAVAKDDSVKDPRISEMTPQELEQHLEDSELQNLLNEHSVKCKAEVTRYTNRLRAERRVLRTQAMPLATDIWCPDEIVDRIISQHQDLSFKSSQPGSSKTPWREDGLMINLWVLQQVLSELEIPLADQALQHVAELSMTKQLKIRRDELWGLLEALEWVAMNANRDVLLPYDFDAAKHRQNSESSESSGGHFQVRNHATEAAKSEAAVKSTEKSGSFQRSDTESDDDNDPSKLIGKYLQIRASILSTEVDVDQGRASLETLQRLRTRLQKIENDVLFDDREALQAWRLAQPQIQADVAIRRRTFKADDPVQQPASLDTADVETADLDESDHLSDPEDMFGDMFAVSDKFQPGQMHKSTSHDEMQLVDFGDWSGTHPRKVLEEFCKGRDSRSKIVVKMVATNYASRHRLAIFWTQKQVVDPWAQQSLPPTVSLTQNPRSLVLEMHKLAASTGTQSEAYISTLALFVVVSNGPRDQKVHLRLPPVWRDVWKEMLTRRSDAITALDKVTLKSIRSMIRSIQDRHQSSDTTAPTSTDAAVPTGTRRPAVGQGYHTISLGAEDAREAWKLKSSTPSYQNMLRKRKELPIHEHRDTILNTVMAHAVTILCAETGAGKSTQVPSFILEHEWGSGRDCRIIVTQPRRISAMSLARRVSQELGEGLDDLGTQKSLVGFAIRLESRVSSSTRITFATTGVLLRMLEQSRDLEHVDYVILDEVHERTMDLDLLFIAVRKIVLRNPKLRVLLMSATIDALNLSSYFGGAPILNISGRTFPVELRFLEDAVEETIDRLNISKRSLHPENEDEEPEHEDEDGKNQPPSAGLKGYRKETQAFLDSMNVYRIDYNLIVQLLRVISEKPRYQRFSAAVLIFMPGMAEIRRLHNALVSEPSFSRGWIIHLLHSSFSSEDLERAFLVPPPGTRKIVIATNIAETGITIPDVTAVIDSCKEKIMRFDEKRQVSRLVESFTSRSSSRQRRGRAARVQEGLCFHLVTKHRYDTLMMEQHVPEMLRLSLQDPILRIKIWDLGPIEETLKAAIDPPHERNVRRAIGTLQDVGALTKEQELTNLGRKLAFLPLNVELGKLALYGVVFRCLDATVTIASILSSKSLFVGGGRPDLQAAGGHESDLVSSYFLFQGWKKAMGSRTAAEFCRKTQLSAQALSQAEEQRLQLLDLVSDAGFVSFSRDEKMALKTARSRRLGSDFFQVPERYQRPSGHDQTIYHVIGAAFYPKLLLRQGKHWRNVATNQHVDIARDSVNRSTPVSSPWMSFYQAMKSPSGHLSVSETSVVPEAAVALLLGQAEFAVYAGVIKLDGSRIQLAVRDYKLLFALKILRHHLLAVVEQFLRTPGTEVNDVNEAWITLWEDLVNGRDRWKAQLEYSFNRRPV